MGAPSESESEAKSAKAADMAAAPTATPKGSPSFTDDFGVRKEWADNGLIGQAQLYQMAQWALS